MTNTLSRIKKDLLFRQYQPKPVLSSAEIDRLLSLTSLGRRRISQSAWSAAETPTVARMNQKGNLIDVGASIAAAATYAGQLAYCISTGSGFTIDTLYERDTANANWNILWQKGLINRLTTDTLSINGTVSTGLSVPLAANTNYAFKLHLYCAGTGDGFATGAGFQLQIHALAAGASLINVNGFMIIANAVSKVRITAVTTNFGGVLSNTGGTPVEVTGIITVGANATTLQIDMVDNATGVTGGDATKAGSWIEAVPIA